MQVNIPKCDYLTLTTYQNHEALLSSFADLFPSKSAKDMKVRGYEGKQWDSLFLGTGRQQGRTHHMLQCSGELSETILFRTRDINCRCTRVDLQVTIWLPKNFSSDTLYNTLTSLDIEWPGRRLVPVLVKSGDGLDTIYVGSRTSDRFVRIYVKPGMDGNPHFLRFEVEFKGVLADRVRNEVTKAFVPEKSIMRAELNRLPFAASRALRAFSDVLGNESHKIAPETVLGQNKTLDWLETQVEPAVFRMLNSHEHRDRMSTILRRWLDYST